MTNEAERAVADAVRSTADQRRQSAMAVQGGASATGSPFPPIADYGFLSDCHVNALLAPSGNVEWMCVPRPDSPSIFATILDRAAGGFRVGPEEQHIPAGRRYIPGTNVLETTWQTPTGWLLVHDFLSMGPWYHTENREHAHRRIPDDWDSEHMLIRVIRCLQGELEVSVDCEPVFDYGRIDARWAYTGEGYGQASATAEGTDLVLTLSTSLRLGIEGRRASARTRIHEGETEFVALSWADHPPPVDYDDAYAAMQRTEAYWREWLSAGQLPRPPLAGLPAAQRARAQGADVHADRRAAGSGHHVVAGDPAAASATGTTATAGSATRPSPCGACTRSASTTRPTTSSRSSPTSAATIPTCR